LPNRLGSPKWRHRDSKSYEGKDGTEDHTFTVTRREYLRLTLDRNRKDVHAPGPASDNPQRTAFKEFGMSWQSKEFGRASKDAQTALCKFASIPGGKPRERMNSLHAHSFNFHSSDPVSLAFIVKPTYPSPRGA